MGKEKENEKIAALETKFSDIKAIREKILGDAAYTGKLLKQMYSQRKALSPEGMVKNIKSISSFLENFTRMISSMGTKLNTLSESVETLKNNMEKIEAASKSL